MAVSSGPRPAQGLPPDVLQAGAVHALPGVPLGLAAGARLPRLHKRKQWIGIRSLLWCSQRLRIEIHRNLGAVKSNCPFHGLGQVDGKSYLVADLTLQCGSDRWNAFLAFDVAMIFVSPS